ncbi:MAG TPA: hypothetical protein VJ461_05640 [Candidatus Nanoarchaeia archaeon]|nr:hypothetical protein [Candidatus Nanoarchaeia archaeon]
MKITKTKVALALVFSAWMTNAVTTSIMQYKVRAKELAAINERPALVALYEKRTQLYEQETPQLLLLSEIDRLQRKAKENYLEQVASSDCINQKKIEAEKNVSALETQINQIDNEINRMYSADSELSNLQKQYGKYQYRGLFPLSLFFK